MSLSIGIVIPCFKPHIPFLIELLDSIQLQTRMPDQVVVSCSSTENEDIPSRLIDERQYKFPLKIYTHPEKRNAAQNRNYGVSKIDTDIICFIDADDTMSPQKFQVVEKCFNESDSVILLLHNYQPFVGEYKIYNDFPLHFNKLSVCPFGSVIHKDGPYRTCNSQVSVRKEIFKGTNGDNTTSMKFREEPKFHAKEDTVFCTDIIRVYPLNTAYCPLSLSKYRHSRTMDTFTFNS